MNEYKIGFAIMVIFIIIGVVHATAYNVPVGTCLILGNDTVCGVQVPLNITKVLDFGQNWTIGAGLNVTVIAPTFPYINDTRNMTYGSNLTWNPYNLTVFCANNITYESKELNINETWNSPKHFMNVTCAPGAINITDMPIKELYPGEQFFNVSCLHYPVNLNGTIVIDNNETFNHSWIFSNEEWDTNCSVNVNPTPLFLGEIHAANDYRECENNYNGCVIKANDAEQANQQMLTITCICVVIGSIFAVLWIMDMFKAGQWLFGAKDMIDKVKETVKQRKEGKATEYKTEIPKKDPNYYKKRYGL